MPSPIKDYGLIGDCHRYDTGSEVDGLPHGEGTFLIRTFWFANNPALQGRHGEAREIFEGLLALRNDVGLLAEQYDPRSRRLLGNFPQAFSHVGLINTARALIIVWSTEIDQHPNGRPGRRREPPTSLPTPSP